MSDFPDPSVQEDEGALAADNPRATQHTRALQIIAGVLIVAALALLLRGLLTPASPAAAPSGRTTPGAAATATPLSANPLIGQAAPDVTVRDMHDKLTPISSLRGSVVLLNFWYVSCPPCQIEMPALERSYLKHQSQGFKVVGLDVVDDSQTISTFTSRLGITYPILRDIGERAVLAYQIRATPSSFLIDRNGVVRAVYIGPVSASALEQALAPLLTSP